MMEEYTEERLEAAQAAVEEELAKWQERGMDVGAWRMGNQELLVRIEILVLIDVIKEHLGVSDLELNIRLKEHVAEKAREMFPQANEMRRAALRSQIVDGIPPMFKPKGEG